MRSAEEPACSDGTQYRLVADSPPNERLRGQSRAYCGSTPTPCARASARNEAASIGVTVVTIQSRGTIGCHIGTTPAVRFPQLEFPHVGDSLDNVNAEELPTDIERRLRIWKQTEVPVVLRRTGKRELLRARLPGKPKFDYCRRTLVYLPIDQQAWLNTFGGRSPTWNEKHKCWELPKSWFNEFVNRCLERYGRVYIFQPYHLQEKCAPACQNAEGHECQCSCMGQYHGVGNDGTWFEVSETFATRWGDKMVACRLLTRTPTEPRPPDPPV